MKLRAFTISILIGSFFAFTHESHAYYLTEEESCSPIDFRLEFPMAIRNQGNISWCYAHSTADYLQFYFKIPTQISAADLAIQYNLHSWPRFLRWILGAPVGETGFARTVMWDALQSGYCPEEFFPSETWTKRILNGPFKGKHESVLLKDAINDLMSLSEQFEMGLYVSPNELPYVYEFKNVTDLQFFELIKSSPRLSVPNELRVAACQGHRKEFPGTIGAIGMRPKGLHTFEKINAVLGTHTPVNVDFFYGFLNHIDPYRRPLKRLHSAVLMGRRFHKASSECQYLIKNSYGTDCTEYDVHHQCEAGYIWVSESSLYKAMVSYVYVKDVLVDDSGPDLKTERIEPVSDDPDDQLESNDPDE